MKLKKIELQAFKAFPNTEPFELNGKNMLLFGENGSGKSSLYWALYYGISAFDFDNIYLSEESIPTDLRNRFVIQNKETYIKLIFENDGIVKISDKEFENYREKAGINDEITLKMDIMQKAYQSSEFMSYKLLYSFYHFHESNKIDLFELFKNEFFPFWQNDRNESFAFFLNDIIEKLEKLKEQKIKVNGNLYKNDFQNLLSDFNTQLTNYLNDLTPACNEWYQVLTEETNLKIRFELSQSLGVQKYDLIFPKINLFLKVDELEITRPHNYLNESRLTMFALAIRLASFEKRLSESEFKILVLDDLLLSLDMNNRMKVFEHLLFSSTSKFKDYQKFIFTHDESLYNLIKHKTLSRDWVYYKMYEDKTNKKPEVKLDEDDFYKAKRFFEDKEFDTCANHLRKEAERLLKIYLDKDLSYIEKEFKTLQELIKTAHNKVNEEDLASFEKKFKLQLSEIEIQGFEEFVEKFKRNEIVSELPQGKIRGILKNLMLFFLDMQKSKDNAKQIIKDLENIKDRILNPRSHSQILNVAPLYQEELLDAIQKIEKLREFLENI